MAEVKACEFCGEPFVASHHQQRFCSRQCRDGNRTPGMTTVRQNAKAEREQKAERRRSFLARRDAEYAAHAAPVKSVEERDGVRIETRGNRFCGSLSGVHRQMVTDKGVVYVA